MQQANVVRSLNGIIVTNRVQVPNLAKMFLWVFKTNLEGVRRDPIFPGGGGDETQFNFWGLFLACK